jgi:tRNA G18 (ribose-2'-O)-methylase SpoU
VSTPTTIDDPDDPRVSDYRALNDAALRRAIEGDRICIAEGAFVVERVLRHESLLRSALIADRRWTTLGSLGDRLVRAPIPVYVAPQAVMSSIAGFDIHRGVLASLERPSPVDLDELLLRARTIAVLEGINDHENMGAIFRNAAALGIDAVLLDPTCCDPLYRRSIRVSMGAVLDLPFARVSSFDEIEGFTLVGLTPRGEDELHRLDLDRVALALGAEGSGLSEKALAACSHRMRIPMRPDTDSLGVASAAAIAFHLFGSRTVGPH